MPAPEGSALRAHALLTPEVFQKGTYLNERDAPGAIEGYEAERRQIAEMAGRAPHIESLLAERAARLGQHAGSIASGFVPEWARIFLPLLIADPTGFAAGPRGQEIREALEGHTRSDPYALPLLTAVESFLGEIYERCGRAFDPAADRDVLCHLGRWHMDNVGRTARYALHVAYTGSGLDYAEWCSSFRGTEAVGHPWLDVAREFPVLIRWLWNIHRFSLDAIVELVQRLERDRGVLETQFGIPLHSGIVGMRLGLSDPHRCGRTVIGLRFRSGHALVYKPRSLEIEAEFNRFAQRHRKTFSLDPLHVLVRDGYGWVEDASPRRSSRQAMEYPEAVGRSAAAFWLLNATDLHFENVLAGEGGVTVLDLETLLAAPVETGGRVTGPEWRRHTINATLLFDTRLSESRKGLKVAGFDPDQNPEAPVPQISFLVDGRDVRMEVARPPEPDLTDLARGRHAPEHVERVVGSFDALLDRDGPALLEQLVRELPDECCLRFVPRETLFYTRLIERLRQPRFLRDGARAELDLLGLHLGVPPGLAARDALHVIIQDETTQLLRGDVPYFAYRVGATDLETSSGKIGHFFRTTPREFSLKKIRGIEASDRAEQRRLLHVALGGLGHGRELRATVRADDAPIGSHLRAYMEDVLDTAFRPSDAPARWLSLFGDVSAENLKAEVGDSAFFGGAWGILLALQAVEWTCASDRPSGRLSGFLDRQAEDWSRITEEHTRQGRTAVSEPLGFAGMGGELFAQAWLLRLDRERWGWLSSAIGHSLEGSERAIAGDKMLDVIGGVAGFVLGCEQLLQVDPDAPWRDVAFRAQQSCVSHLIDRALEVRGGLCWRVAGEPTPALGFAHGWAGIVTALASAGRRSPPGSDVRRAIDACLSRAARYPQALLEASGDWFDLRKGVSDGTPLNASWCNGIPGFLRGMLEVRAFWDEDVRERVEDLIGRTRGAIHDNEAFRFCCGVMGRIDFVLDYDRAFGTWVGEPELQSRVLDIFRRIAEADASGESARYPELIFPGLFQGRSGMAYCAARLFNPDLPSLSGQSLADVAGGLKPVQGRVDSLDSDRLPHAPSHL